VSPASAGTISGATTTMSINWAVNFFGTAFIYVAGVNNCGTGALSTGYEVTVRTKPPVTFLYCFDSITSVNAKPITLKG
ncbi:MAG: hypothetical protein WCL00_04870, partial [Bacteroidota bacterium]